MAKIYILISKKKITKSQSLIIFCSVHLIQTSQPWRNQKRVEQKRRSNARRMFPWISLEIGELLDSISTWGEKKFAVRQGCFLALWYLIWSFFFFHLPYVDQIQTHWTLIHQMYRWSQVLGNTWSFVFVFISVSHTLACKPPLLLKNLSVSRVGTSREDNKDSINGVWKKF